MMRVHQIELELQNEELRRSELQLGISRERYFDLYDLAPFGYLTISEKGLITEGNLTFASMLGLTKTDLLNQPFHRNIIREDQDIYYLSRKLLWETGAPQKCGLRLVKPDGVPVWVHLEGTLVRDADGVSIVRVAVIDITQRKQAEELLRRIAETALVPSSMNELYGAMHRLIGRLFSEDTFCITRLDNVTGESVMLFCADEVNNIPERRAFEKEMTKYILRLGRTAYLTMDDMSRLRGTGEYTLKYAQKSKVRQYLGAPLMDLQNKPFGVISLGLMEESRPIRPEDVEVFSAIAVQVSLAIECKRAANELDSLYQKAEAGSRAKSGFLSNMSHELRTPLNAIIGFSEVLKDKLFGPLNNKQEKYVGNILFSAKHLLGLIGDVLDLNKIEAGKMELETSLINIKESCQGSVALFRDRAKLRQVKLRFIPDPTIDDVKIVADGRRIKQILDNLIDNGIKYNKFGGNLTITVEKIDEGVNSAAIRIVVEDTGIGISSDDLAKLFKPFGQLSRASNELIEGTGLGLVLTKYLVKLHGGKINVESELGKGSRFIVTIPTQKEPT